jgi:hypothetical protein
MGLLKSVNVHRFSCRQGMSFRSDKPPRYGQMSVRKDILLTVENLVAQRELSLRKDNCGRQCIGIVGARKQFSLVAGDFTSGWKCHAVMTICE